MERKALWTCTVSRTLVLTPSLLRDHRCPKRVVGGAVPWERGTQNYQHPEKMGPGGE